MGRYRWEIAQVVVFAAVGDGAEIFRIFPVGDAYAGNLSLLCHIHCLLFFHNGIIGKLIPGDHGTGIPLHEVEALARILLPQIQAFFESEEGQKEFAEWKSKKEDVDH